MADIKQKKTINITPLHQAHQTPQELEADLCETRKRIIAESKDLFIHYGYGKTTIGDIASACEMSPGNIYRFFDSKLDIATLILKNALLQFHKNLSAEVAKANLAEEKMRVFAMDNLHRSYNFLEDTPQFVELINSAVRKKPEIRKTFRERERELIEKILKLGSENKEFKIDCVSATARTVQCMLAPFRWSRLSAPRGFNKIERLKVELEATILMTLTALKKGCFLESIMSKHPQHQNCDEAKPESVISNISDYSPQSSPRKNITLPPLDF